MEEKKRNIIEHERTARLFSSLKEQAEKSKAIEDMLEDAVEMYRAVDEEYGFEIFQTALGHCRCVENQEEYEEAFERLCFELFMRFKRELSFEQMNRLYDDIHSLGMFKQYSNYEFHILWNFVQEQLWYWDCEVIGQYDRIMESIRYIEQ